VEDREVYGKKNNIISLGGGEQHPVEKKWVERLFGLGVTQKKKGLYYHNIPL